MFLRLADWISESPEEALATSARLVQDDLVLMVKRDGEFESIQTQRDQCL
jgi:hypothetical protein